MFFDTYKSSVSVTQQGGSELCCTYHEILILGGGGDGIWEKR